MSVKRLDHVVVVVDDMESSVAFFQELGLEIEGAMPISGDWVDRINGMQGIDLDIVTLRTPDGHGRLELTAFRSPAAITPEPSPPPPNALGLRSVMFAVEDIDDVVARLERHGGELMGEITQYEDLYRLCYMRGPAGMIVALAEELR